jgi:hypothetical protein
MTGGRAAGTVPDMTSTTHLAARRPAGTALLAGAAILLASAISAAIAENGTSVSDDLYRYPFTPGAWVAFVLAGVLAAALLAVGVAGLRRTGLAGASRGARRGLGAVVAGMSLLAVCQAAGLLLTDHAMDGTGAIVADTGFGIATLSFTFGMVVAGRAALRDGGWDGWRRRAPLACGVLSLVVLPLQATSLLWLGAGILALGYAVLGAALASDPVVAPVVRTA